ncbi:MAG: DUF692 domain-containing protein [Halobacteriovoraceae bacterium]|jgi:uncharacterized protein|nr:DUF692 domain-containing protein [Halobacteriovoraceae bacterium]
MQKNLTGVGINLRLEYIDEILTQLPKLPFLEIIADNWLSLGPHHQKLAKLREHYEISFHCVGMNIGGSDIINTHYIKKIKELCDTYQPFQISDHLSYQANNGFHHHDLLPIPYTKKYLINTSDRVMQLQDLLKQTLIVENPTYYTAYAESDIAEEDFLNQLAINTNCKLLIDLNNIWVNSQNFKINIDQYMTTINWAMVKEIHLAGPDIMGEFYIDTHGSDINHDLFQMIKKYQDKLIGLPIFYERDNNIPKLDVMLHQVEKVSEVLYD